MSTSIPRMSVGLLMILTALTGILTPARVAYAASITVTTTADEISTNGACSLREAIRAANLNTKVDSCVAGSASGTDTVTVPAGTFVLTRVGADEEASLTGDLDVNGSLKINGAGAAQTIIDGNASDRVLNVKKDAKLTLTKVTIQNGLVGEFPATGVNGGGILNSGTLVLNAVTISGNSAIQHGGGIYNNGSLSLTSTTVNSNHASSSGGGIYNVASGNLTITRSTISDNSAEGTSGGIETVGALTITFSTIRANRSNHGGGGIAVVDTGTAQITSSTIIENNAQESGGGLVTYGGSATLTNTTVSGNGTGESDEPTWGAGVDNSGGALTLRSSTVTGNRGGTGGLVGPATLANTIVAGNSGLVSTDIPDCYGSIISQGYNLIGNTTGCTISGVTTGNILNRSANLGPLKKNSGPTMTHALLTGSPAIDAGNSATPGSSTAACPAKDQRDIVRPQDGNGDGTKRCDIGAVERRSVSQP